MRRRTSLVLALFVGAATVTCFGATEVRIELMSDVPCSRVGHVRIEIGAANGSPPTSVTDDAVCHDGSPTDLGSLVVVPSGARDERLSIRVLVALDKTSIEACAAGADLTGCIIARRSHRFTKHRSGELPIVLSADCIGVLCDAEHTCVGGRCASADTSSSDFCAASASCSDSGAPSSSSGGTTSDAMPDAAIEAGPTACDFGGGATALSNVPRMYALTAMPSAIYGLRAGASLLDFVRLPRGTSAFDVVATRVATASASDTHEFWLAVPPGGGAGSIYSQPAGATTSATKLSDTPGNPFIAEGDHAFAIESDPNGEAFWLISPAPPLRLGSGGPFEYYGGFAVGEDRLFFGETTSTIRSLPKNAAATATTEVTLTAGANIQQILTDRPGSDLYFTEGTLGLARYSGGTVTKLASPKLLFGFQLDATDLYWLEPDGAGASSLMRIAKTGGAVGTRLSGVAANTVFAIDAKCLYWWDGDTMGTLHVEPK